ncbi:unnamed protein product [Phyllotreta striolata]|uniref:Uncharacterized protein n=1 Tax=Phyllotreta striolata TaxID=444603 RepID=A0A9N9XL17_PHYSR|nr:unnamed protein product [Phyllotreta striolata]
MKGAVFALFFAVAISSSYAATTTVGCTCPNLLTGVVNLISQLQDTLAPLLNPLGGLGNLVSQILDAVKNLVEQLGNALSNGNLLSGVNDLVANLLGQH